MSIFLREVFFLADDFYGEFGVTISFFSNEKMEKESINNRTPLLLDGMKNKKKNLRRKRLNWSLVFVKCLFLASNVICWDCFEKEQ